MRLFELAAAAEAAGYRACLRCRPYRVAGAVPWEASEVVCRAVQLIIAGVLDEGTEAELGARLGLSGRHLRRMFQERLGVTPDQLARSRRAHFARRLLDDTDLGIADVAFASGFGSLRQFNRTMAQVFRDAPHRLRERRRRADRLAADGGLAMRLPVTSPYDWDSMVSFLGERAVPGVESVVDGCYRRVVTVDGDPGLIEVERGADDHLVLQAHLPHWEGLIHVVERISRLFATEARATEARAGRRVAGVWAPFEVGVRLVAGAAIGELVRAYGTPVPGLTHGLSHAFPGASTLADAGDVPPVVRAFAQAVVDGRVRLDGTDTVDVAAVVPGYPPAAARELATRLGVT